MPQLSPPRLFHVSEEPGIKIFTPRPAGNTQAGVSGDAVWAIDNDHLAHYLLPRDCPRVTLRRGPATTDEDARKFFPDGHERIIAIEMDWYERVKAASLFLYELPPESFTKIDEIAGYWISRQAVTPITVHNANRLIESIVEHGYKLRLLPNLWPLRDAAVASTIQYSIVRMRLAKPLR